MMMWIAQYAAPIGFGVVVGVVLSSIMYAAALAVDERHRRRRARRRAL